jgi:hypothetical protein
LVTGVTYADRRVRCNRVLAITRPSETRFIHLTKEITMTKNVGGIDRTLRIVIGVALIAAAATGAVGVWGYLGVVPLLTGLVGWCPPYAMLGFNTCKTKG